MNPFLIDITQPPDNRQVWVALAVAVAATAFVMFRPKGRKKDPLATPPKAFGNLASERAVEREMQNLLVELSEMSRQISSQLDTRAAKLELLIREADEKIAQLSSMGNGAASSTTAVSTPAAPPDEASEACTTQDLKQEQRVFPASAPLDPRHAAVYEMADQGRAAQEIAHALGRPNGEIELILALRPPR